MRVYTEQKAILEYQMALRQRERISNEFLDQRDRYAQIMYALHDYIKGTLSNDVREQRPFPEEAMEQVDIAKGLLRYEWPE